MSLFFSTFHHQTSFRLCSRYSSSSFSKSSSGIKRLSSSFFFVNESERKTFPHRRVHFSRTRMSKRDFGDTKTAATSSKRHQSMTGTEDTIGTHDGSFHCDEALGSPTAESFAREMPTALAECAVVLDVGAEYDVAKLRFDHHQKGFSETFNDFKTKLSSAGLVYKHFGKEIVSKKIEKSVEDPVTNQLYLKMYKSFIEAVDGVDNGVFYFFSLSLSLSLSSKAFRLRINVKNQN
ncbi:unnamed protein product [Bathycoccus prasinos]